jgi:peroxiredoxin
MRRLIFFALCVGTLLSLKVSADSEATKMAGIGQTAPNFILQGGDGKMHSLADYQGKFVVLEWTNPQCPFVHKFYDSGTMQKLQKEETGKGVVWLRINSSAEDKEGFQNLSEIASYEKEHHVASTVTLVDPKGTVGHTYGARTTPHIFVINPKGVLIYAGGIDNRPSPNPEDIAGATSQKPPAEPEAWGM